MTGTDGKFYLFEMKPYAVSYTHLDVYKRQDRGGADLIEIGIPFSDPIAEGEVIQEANIRALAAGTTTDKVFSMVENVRKKIQTPIVFLTYLNPVFFYGYEKFFKRCREAFVDGIIIPDLPYEEKQEVCEIAEAYGVDVISMIAPTSEERIQRIAKDAKGFLYVVSSMGVTGVRSEINTDLSSDVYKRQAGFLSSCQIPLFSG